MQKLTHVLGKTIPLAIDNVDTDLIIPAQYLTAITRKGFGENLFRRLKEQDPDFSFNQAKFAGANILVTKRNFGCGSSREHAVWALQEAGIQCVIAASFADIFSGNSAKNGLLLIALPENSIKTMLENTMSGNYALNIDIENQKITDSFENTYTFEMNPFQKYCIMNGLDDLEYLLQHRDLIALHKNRRAAGALA